MVSVLVSLVVVSASACLSVASLQGPIVRPFAPIGQYAGHWGVDVATPVGGSVVSVMAGTVSFSGSVAGRRSVTVTHADGIRVSYSYLASISVSRGQQVRRGERIGTVGLHGGVPSFHMSLRIDGVYRDPMILFRCLGPPGPALWLAPRRTIHAIPYALGRVRNTRRNVRPATHRPPCRRPRCV
ncbi:MAG: M23 family peptidase [Armatimonadetes bacterium]|nr:MAG: M23 family peptidase [Armatimonadota bacterium]